MLQKKKKNGVGGNSKVPLLLLHLQCDFIIMLSANICNLHLNTCSKCLKLKVKWEKELHPFPLPEKNNKIIIKQYKANSNSNDNNNKWYIKHNHYNLRSIKKNFCKSDCHVKIESVKNIEGISEVTVLMKGRVHSKLKMLASFTHTRVLPNLYDFLYDERQNRC